MYIGSGKKRVSAAAEPPRPPAHAGTGDGGEQRPRDRARAHSAAGRLASAAGDRQRGSPVFDLGQHLRDDRHDLDRVSLLPGRLSRIAARRPGASRTSSALNVTSPDLGPLLLQRQRVFGGRPQVLARQRHHLLASCAVGDVDAPLARVHVGVLEDVDQLQPFAERPRPRAQVLGGFGQPRTIRAGTALSAFHRRSRPRCSSSRAARSSMPSRITRSVAAATRPRPSPRPSA